MIEYLTLNNDNRERCLDSQHKYVMSLFQFKKRGSFALSTYIHISFHCYDNHTSEIIAYHLYVLRLGL